MPGTGRIPLRLIDLLPKLDQTVNERLLRQEVADLRGPSKFPSVPSRKRTRKSNGPALNKYLLLIEMLFASLCHLGYFDLQWRRSNRFVRVQRCTLRDESYVRSQKPVCVMSRNVQSSLTYKVMYKVVHLRMNS